MQVSKILYNQRLNTKNISFKSSKETPCIQEYKQIAPEQTFNYYWGQDMLPQKISFETTLDKNWFRLPAKCKPDRFQTEAAKALYEGNDVLASAPTGTGKTAIAHYAVSKNMEAGKKTFYTTPIKALSNQKLNEFRDVYGEENVGILTGDRRENTEAPIIIMTTEVYRNMALSNMYGEENPIMENLGTVIFDEFHYLDDKDRGSVWEESVMMTPKNVQKLALSATMGNLNELNGWYDELSSYGSELVSIPESERNVPLMFDSIPTASYKREEKRIKKSIKRTGGVQNSAVSTNLSKPVLNDFKFMINKLHKKDQLPAIIFVFSKKYSRELLDYLGSGGEDLTTPEEKENIEKIVNKYKSKRYIGTDLDIETLKKGYAIHNAGIIPAQKELIEELFQKKLLKVIIATETLAAGINMPAKTVVISTPYKPSDDEETEALGRLLNANEFKQMSGRAGRRGIDTVGYVYTMPTSKEIEEEFSILENSQSNPIYSHYSPDYAFLAGYIDQNNEYKSLENLYGKSFYAYSKDKNSKKSKVEELMSDTAKKIAVMKKRGMITDNHGLTMLSDEGYTASKVRGYNAITLAETVHSKVFNEIYPEALAMVAAGIANPAANSHAAVKAGTNFSPVFKSFQDNADSVYNRLYYNTDRALAKLGKSINSFSSYDEMISYIESIERPNTGVNELNARHSALKKKMSILDTIRLKEKYPQSRLLSDLQEGKVIPMASLEDGYAAVRRYKSSLKEGSIAEHIERLNYQLKSLAEPKGNKSRVSFEKQSDKIKQEIEEAETMQYLDSKIENEMDKNRIFMRDNSSLESDYRECERLLVQLTSHDTLLSMVKGLKSIDEYQLNYDLAGDNFRNYSKVKSCYNELLTRNASIHSDELEQGITNTPEEYGKSAAEHVYNWAMLNRINSDGLSNWKQVLKISGDSEEGVIYREILQTADLLSQIGEMADAGYEKAINEDDLEYYARLKNTAMSARQLILNEPVSV